jgi:hypothetical protein
MKFDTTLPSFGMHPWAVGIENPHNFYAEIMLAPVIKKQCLGAALSFIVTGPHSDRIDAPPVALRLRMDFRIAVDFRSRGLQDARSYALGQTQHIDGTMGAGLGGLYWVNEWAKPERQGCKF